MTTNQQVTYENYLKTSMLLNLQQELSSPPHPDELIFIIIHQSHELWFKLVIHEIHRLLSCLDQNLIFECCKTLNRLNQILKALCEQMNILHTLSPDEFLGYRKELGSASGFQSHQYREVEFLFGLKDAKYLEKHTENTAIYNRLKEAMETKTVWERFLDLLSRNGPEFDKTQKSSILEALVKVYSQRIEYSGVHFLCEALIEVDTSLQLWRIRHFKNAEKTIGFKQGTGGSLGVEYLCNISGRKLFPELWEIRTML